MKYRNISVFGLGYIGLPTAALFAKNGLHVHGVDISENICDAVNNTSIPIEEPFLSEIVTDAVKKGLLKASCEPQPADAFIIAVPTPVTNEKKADLTCVAAAARRISRVLKKGGLVILESTVPPLYTNELLVPELEKSGLSAKKDFFVAHCPERVLPGQIINELENNSRIIGGYTQEGAEEAKELYSLFVKAQIYLTDAATAEICKLMENTYRDVNIALSNELLKICEALRINVWEAILLANKHPRVNLHQPGPGVGGHCLAVDPWFIVEKAPEQARLIASARRANDAMPEYIYKHIKGILRKGKILLLGCAYKPGVSDARESPILKLFGILKKDGYDTVIYDPHIKKYCGDLLEKAKNADLLVLAVGHSEFNGLDFVKLKEVMRSPIIFDTRNFIQKENAVKAGFSYYLLGGSYEKI